MARKVKSARTIGKSVIDWQQLLDGRPYRFRKGKDFTNAKTLRTSAHQAARRAGRRATTSAEESGDLVVQFFDPDSQS